MPATAGATLKSAWAQFFYILYCFEAGIFLLLVPWSLLWIHSYYAQIPALRGVLLSGFTRGAVSGIGCVLLTIGFVDLAAFCRAMKRA